MSVEHEYVSGKERTNKESGKERCISSDFLSLT
jgi:hypothetical protein